MHKDQTRPYHVVVIDPAMRVPELDCFNQIARSAKCWTSYHLPALHGFDSLEQLANERIDGVVILRSGASVYDNLPWQAPLLEWVRTQALDGIPTLGLCYGHQMIAHAFVHGSNSYGTDIRKKEVALFPSNLQVFFIRLKRDLSSSAIEKAL